MTASEVLTSHLGAGILLGILVVTRLLHSLSRRLGDVTKMRPYYFGYTIGSILILVATLGYLFRCSAGLVQSPAIVLSTAFALIAFYIPLALGVSINCAVALIYWGWLFRRK